MTIVYVGFSDQFEYFCWSCGQLRLSLRGKDNFAQEGCGNCGSHDCKVGEMGSLDKDALLVERETRR